MGKDQPMGECACCCVEIFDKFCQLFRVALEVIL